MLKNSAKKTSGIFLLALGLSAWNACAEPSLQENFRNPPDSAKPYAWWHWMSGEVSKAGITQDLEGMKAAGIGGATIFELGGGDGRIFDTGKNRLFSDDWKALVKHALQEAGALQRLLSRCRILCLARPWTQAAE